MDRGLQSDSLHFVGAYAALAWDNLGALYVAYADQSTNDVALARQTADGFSYSTLMRHGAYGSFIDLEIDGQGLFISTYQRQRDDAGRDISHLVVKRYDLSDVGNGG